MVTQIGNRAYAALLTVGYIATIPSANWLIGHFGTVCIDRGPCLIPVLPGVMAPSGVLMIGIALLLRDLVQRQMGALWSLFCIVVGAIVSLAIAPPALALASAVAFLSSELVDFGVYTPLARRRFYTALVASCMAGAVVDSAVFLWLAFGSLDHLAGQIVGKGYAVLIYASIARIRTARA